MNRNEIQEINQMVTEFNDEVKTEASVLPLIQKSDVVPMGPEMIDYDPENEEGDHNSELGAEFPLDDALDDTCGPPNNKDQVDDAILDIIDLLVRNDYEDDSAEEATYDAIASLIADEAIEDTPDLHAKDEIKAQWIHNSIPKIKERLHQLGVEYDESM